MVALLVRRASLYSVGILMVLPWAGKVHASPPVPVASEVSRPSLSMQISVSDEQGAGALNFVKSTAEKGLTFLSAPDSPQEQKKSEFKKLLDHSFDLETIGRFVLGKYWNVATPAQQKEYTALFKRMIVEVYAGRFGEYKGEKFEVKSVRSISTKDSLVTSYIVPVNGGEPIQVDWRVRQTGSTYKVVDVLVSGVSMSVTQRSDFSSVIQRGGGDVAVLIDYLKQKF
ncbi:MAG: ABC transporter substrate-binding protein [Alphaproteobacteria bacterium]|nr:ABC transporter substrate-binding protein [Alphaproteobacteria bacterium]